MHIFFDRNLPPQLARMVEIFDVKREHAIIHHDQRFQTTTSDVEWLNALGKDSTQWVVITQDYAIMRKRVERDALKNANLKKIFLKDAWLHLPIHEKAWKFLRIWPSILSAARDVKHGAFEVPVKAVKCVHLPL